MAEREGFEPSEHLLGAHTISNRAPSASRASLRMGKPGGTGVSPVLRCAMRTLQKLTTDYCTVFMAEGVGFEPTWE